MLDAPGRSPLCSSNPATAQHHPIASPHAPHRGAAPPAGASGAQGKLFKVQVRLLSAAARQIPALSFGYFDPEKGTYQVARSQPGWWPLAATTTLRCRRWCQAGPP